MNLKELGWHIDPMTNIQREFLNDWQHRFFVVPAGRRSRKTIIGILKVINHALFNPDYKYFFGAPTRDQAKKIFWDRLKRMVKHMGIQGSRFNETSLDFHLINGALIRVLGLDVGERVEGETPSYNGCLITEMGNTKRELWGEHIRPILSDTNGFGILEGVPEGFNHYYDLACYACNGMLPKTQEQIGAKCENPNDPEWVYYSWFSSDVLSEVEIQAAKRQLDPKTFRQEYEAEFIQNTSTVYYCFENENITDIEFDPTAKTYLCWDFNVGERPMSVTAVQDIDDKIIATKEFVYKESNTDWTCQAILEYFNKKNFNGSLNIVGDIAGKRRESSSIASWTDYIIIDSYFKNYRDYEKRMRAGRIRDRVISMNTLLKNALGERRFLVNAKECPHLTEDFRRVEWAEDGQHLDGNNPNLTHSSDGASYFAVNYYPVAITGAKVEIF